MSIIDYLVRLYAPDDCLGCGREGVLLCRNCLAALPPLPGSCFGCRRPAIAAACSGCLQAAGLSSLSVACAYQTAATELVAALKFSGNRSAAALMARALLRTTSLPAGAVIAHVPATAAHIRERGFDQAALVARELSRCTGLPHRTLLARSGSHHQLGADRAARHRQLAGTVRVVRGQQLTGKRIILVDDVLTTGSSLATSAGILKRAGAQQIDALVFAQA